MNDNLSESPPPERPSRREKVVVHAAYPLWRKHLLMAVARARELQENGSEVLLSYCDSSNGTCAVNYAGSRLTCGICRSRVKRSAAAAGLTVVPLQSSETSASAEPNLSFHEKRDIAEGVQSGVTSTFRQLAGDGSRNRMLRAIKRGYYRTTTGLLRSMKQLLERERPDRLEVFNGRHACSRFSLIAARDLNIPFNTMEVTSRGKPIIFEGHTAHDRIKIQDRILKHPVDFDLAKAYFDRRRKPAANKYAKKHSQAFHPPDGSGFRKRVTVFLSSQDEFESLGRDWQSPFPDYATVVHQICQDNPDYLFCIRFHPNQADMASDIITPFKPIADLPNTIVYYPADTANTYKLVEWSDLVVTFGSTVTIEACWMGKPAIMLGPSFFDQLDISYNPQSMPELRTLLRQDLIPKDRQNAARMARFEELDFDAMRYLRHNGKSLVPQGIRLSNPWLSSLAKASDDVFCRIVKTCAKLSAKYRRRTA